VTLEDANTSSRALLAERPVSLAVGERAEINVSERHKRGSAISSARARGSRIGEETAEAFRSTSSIRYSYGHPARTGVSASVPSGRVATRRPTRAGTPSASRSWRHVLFTTDPAPVYAPFADSPAPTSTVSRRAARRQRSSTRAWCGRRSWTVIVPAPTLARVRSDVRKCTTGEALGALARFGVLRLDEVPKWASAREGSPGAETTRRDQRWRLRRGSPTRAPTV